MSMQEKMLSVIGWKRNGDILPFRDLSDYNKQNIYLFSRRREHTLKKLKKKYHHVTSQ